MVRREIKFTDFNGKSQTEVGYFNINKAELGKLQMRHNGTYLDYLKLLSERKKVEEMYNFVYELILDSYGEKDPEGRKFIKTPEMRTDFEQSLAFSEMIVDLVSNPDDLANFVKGIMPPDLVTGGGEIDATALPATT